MSPSSQCLANPAPRFLFIDINRTCNLRCQHCMYWKAKPDDTVGVISMDRRNEIIQEFAEMNAKGAVVLCGGESMLDLDRYFAVTAKCIESGLRCFSVINGTKVTTVEMADRIIREGPTEVTVSLDSHLQEVHDEMRGVVGSFDKAVRALRLLLKSRAREGRGPKIFAMALICERNYRDLDAFYDFLLNYIGADKLKLNFLQPTFGPPTLWYRDRFFSRNVVRNEEELERVIRACDVKYGLRINPRWLEQVRMYHRSVRNNGWWFLGWRRGKGTEKHICNSYERNIMVDLWGRARLCFYPGFPSFQLNAPGDMHYFWERSDRLRERMRRCNRYCAISHSVRKESATV